jgi:hypothetical protein
MGFFTMFWCLCSADAWDGDVREAGVTQNGTHPACFITIPGDIESFQAFCLLASVLLEPDRIKPIVRLEASHQCP